MATNATGRKRAAKKNTMTGAPGLVAALKFVSMAQRAKSVFEYQTHCVMHENVLYAFDGLLTIGHPIEETLNACPHSGLLALALSKCGEQISITRPDDTKLVIQSEAFKANIGCAKMEQMQVCYPDAKCAVVDNRLKDAIAAVMIISVEGATSLAHGSILVQANTAVATNGHVLIEYWHGIDLPPNLLIPKVAAVAIAGNEKNMVAFGFSDNTVTFWYEDDSFIKTQRMVGEWPKYSKVVDRTTNPFPIYDNFFVGLKAIMPFSNKDNDVRFDEGVMHCGDGSAEVSYEVEGLLSERCFNGKYLLLLESYMKTVDFFTDPRAAHFFGDNCRGAIAIKTLK